MRKIKIIRTKIGDISLLENGIIRVHGNKDIHIELEDMKENDRAYHQLLNGNRAPFLVIFGEDATISLEAREYFSNSKRSRIKIAEALVVPQLHHKVNARFHTNVKKPNFPTRLFQSEDEALAWLLQFC